MSNHQWCRDVRRDEAVRAAEGAAAVPSIQHRDLPEVVAELRERVARLEAAQATIGTGDEIARLTAERDAALREVEAMRQSALVHSEIADAHARREYAVEDEMARVTAERDAAIRERDEARARVAEMEAAAAAPPPRGWLTAQERGALKRAFDLLCDDDGDQPLAGTVQRLLAREAPPRVKVPCYQDESRARDNQWHAAIRAAGVEVEG